MSSAQLQYTSSEILWNHNYNKYNYHKYHQRSNLRILKIYIAKSHYTNISIPNSQIKSLLQRSRSSQINNIAHISDVSDLHHEPVPDMYNHHVLYAHTAASNKQPYRWCLAKRTSSCGLMMRAGPSKSTIVVLSTSASAWSPLWPEAVIDMSNRLSNCTDPWTGVADTNRSTVTQLPQLLTAVPI